MSTNVTGRFNSRQEAETVVERLVQEHGFDRTDIFIAAVGTDNTAGNESSGPDLVGHEPSPGDRGDAPLSGSIEVSVVLSDAEDAERVRSTFAEFGYN